MSETKATNRTFWQALIGPHPDIKGLVDQRRIRIAAVITLLLLVASAALTIYSLAILRQPETWYSLPFLSLFLIAYITSRTRFGTWAPGLLVFGMAVLDFVVLLTTSQPQVVSAETTFVLLPILFATVLVDAWQTLLLVVLINAGLGLYFALSHMVAFSDVLVPFLGTLLVSILSGVTALLRDRDMAIIRDQQKTLDHHSQNLEDQIDQRTRNIVTTAEIGRVVAGGRDLDLMLNQVLNLITERFNYYYAQVFLLDESGRQAVLKAGTGSAGVELLSRSHRLAVGSQSVVGQVTSTGGSVVVADTDSDPIHRRNELLPHTRAEIGLPLRVSGRVIGALNIQSTTANAFQTTDVTVFQTIADQLAVAIENARLFERAQRDLQDIETLNRQLTGEAWRKYLTGRGPGLPTGFSGSVTGIQALQGAVGESASENTVSMPLKVRGETIGVLDVTPRSGQVPDEQMKLMLEAVAERVALALDSTRVGEQAQRQAEREQILSTISAELQATTDLNVILRVVARETSRAMSVPHSFIHLAMNYGEDHKPEEEASTERKRIK
jgi:GAF domain-containing protein